MKGKPYSYNRHGKGRGHAGNIIDAVRQARACQPDALRIFLWHDKRTGFAVIRPKGPGAIVTGLHIDEWRADMRDAGLWVHDDSSDDSTTPSR